MNLLDILPLQYMTNSADLKYWISYFDGPTRCISILLARRMLVKLFSRVVLCSCSSHSAYDKMAAY
ncbi:hypothetical protein DsansV1_C26g0194521 [Dioscorea sansibarensis]